MKYTLRRSTRAKYMRLTVQPGGTVILTVPHRVPEGMIEKFLAAHTEWIEKGVKRMQNLKALPVSGRRSYLKHKEEARAFINERLAYWNAFYGFTHGRIAIKNTKRLWGSCSRKGNLNFSYALLFLPRELADYVIVHELAHLKEHNHSARFWALVHKHQPDYLLLRRELRRYLPQSR
ncbi:MAG: SprT family zinc-dependent metalloprotease [Minisyncoccia bacterium]